jgi:hypothetical protein
MPEVESRAQAPHTPFSDCRHRTSDFPTSGYDGHTGVRIQELGLRGQQSGKQRTGFRGQGKEMLKMQVDPDDLLKTKGNQKWKRINLDECLKTNGLLECRGEARMLIKIKELEAGS